MLEYALHRFNRDDTTDLAVVCFFIQMDVGLLVDMPRLLGVVSIHQVV
jgi:hypothetical protein